MSIRRGKKSGVKCHHCGSDIDHFGFTRDDAMRSNEIRERFGPEGRERHYALTQSIGGTCSQCSQVCCMQCYCEKDYVCPNCGKTIPELLQK